MRLSTGTALAAALAASATVHACGGWRGGEFAASVPLGLEVYAPRPENNAPTPGRVALGQRLFFDRTLSAERTVSCSSCHRPESFFADDEPVSPGVFGRRGHRNTPSLLNVAYARHLTWDGRSRTLEEQVLKPIQDPLEMDLPLDSVVARLSTDGGYRAAFLGAYDAPVSPDGVARALAAYVRTLRSGDAPVDRFRAGDLDALTTEARAGHELFVGKARCSICHGGVMFADGEFHNTGVTMRSGSDDSGRYGRTGHSWDVRAFRTASLRNVEHTAPYMHDGSLATLEEVIEFYDQGGGPDPGRDPDLRPLRLSAQEKRALAAFLRALDSG
jgi:cytochrome c peroxidase